MEYAFISPPRCTLGAAASGDNLTPRLAVDVNACDIGTRVCLVLIFKNLFGDLHFDASARLHVCVRQAADTT